MKDDVNALRADWTEPTAIRFGPGRIAELPALCRDLGVGRPLFVTDGGLADLGILRDAVAACAAQGLKPGVFSELRSNPAMDDVEAGALAYRNGGHDGIVAFGGGTAMDAAKLVALRAGLPDTDPWTFEDTGAPRALPVGPPLPAVLAVPTTAGSGAEQRDRAVITDRDQRRKRVIRHPGLLPIAVIADPVLTIGLPPNLTAFTGLNALSHCLEAYCAPGFDPALDGLAAEGVRLVACGLCEATRDGNNLVARARMMAAAGLGGRVFAKGFGAVQALSDPITVLRKVHHGLATAVLLPYVLRHNRDAVADRVARLAAYAGLERPGLDGFVAWLLAMRQDLGVPHTLQGLGLTRADLPALAEDAARDPFLATNPIPLTRTDVEAVYARALDGSLD